MTNSKRKGKKGELEAKNVFKEFGFSETRRTQQYCGYKEGDSDVTVPGLEQFHFEVKRTKSVKMYDWIKQAERDAKENQYPVVLHKKDGSGGRGNKEQFYAILSLEHLLTIIKETN